MSMTYEAAVGYVRAIYDRAIATPPILDARRYFPNAPRFVERWRDIRDEALAAKLTDIPRFHEIMEAQADISANDGLDWRMLILKAYGVGVPANLSRCPVTASLLRDAPEVASCAMSFLAPGKHIPVHRGPFRGIMRFHLMLSMPRDADGRPSCVMEIDNVAYRLAEGESLLWDDTYPHEVWNRSDTVRVALLLDVVRKDLPLRLRLLSWVIMKVVGASIRWGGIAYEA